MHHLILSSFTFQHTVFYKNFLPTTNSAQYMLIGGLYCCINETKQRELELLVSCLHNHSFYNIHILIHIYVYYKVTVISWLNDCEDMILVVPTLVLFDFSLIPQHNRSISIYWIIFNVFTFGGSELNLPHLFPSSY